MGHKYAIPTVLKAALSRLKKYYTTDLNAWQNVASRDKYVFVNGWDAITVVELARLTDTLSLLPTAYLACCDYIIHAWAEPPSMAGKLVLSDLPSEDTRWVHHGHAVLVKTAASRILSLAFGLPCATCTSPSHCAPIPGRLLKSRDTDGTIVRLQYKAALTPMAPVFLDHPSVRLCSECEKAVRRKDVNLYTATWATLPTLFNLKLDATDWPSKPATSAQ